MVCVHMMEGPSRVHSARGLRPRLGAHQPPPSAIAITLVDFEKTILRAACEGQVAHVLVCITRQEGRGRGGSIMRDEACHSVNVQGARRVWQTHPMQARLV